MIHEVMAMYFKMIARSNRIRVIDIFPVIKGDLGFSNVLDFA